MGRSRADQIGSRLKLAPSQYQPPKPNPLSRLLSKSQQIPTMSAPKETTQTVASEQILSAKVSAHATSVLLGPPGRAEPSRRAQLVIEC